MYLLDTNICIDFLHGRLGDGYKMMQESPRELFKLPAIVAAELLTGIEKAPLKWRHREQGKVEVFLEEFDIVPFDLSCARAFARLRADLESRGLLIGPMDMVIAATALANQAVLVTNNVREFSRVKGLAIESWYDATDIWRETGGQDAAGEDAAGEARS